MQLSGALGCGRWAGALLLPVGGRLRRARADARSGRAGAAPVRTPDAPASPGECERPHRSDRRTQASSAAGTCSTLVGMTAPRGARAPTGSVAAMMWRSPRAPASGRRASAAGVRAAGRSRAGLGVGPGRARSARGSRGRPVDSGPRHWRGLPARLMRCAVPRSHAACRHLIRRTVPGSATDTQTARSVVAMSIG